MTGNMRILKKLVFIFVTESDVWPQWVLLVYAIDAGCIVEFRSVCVLECGLHLLNVIIVPYIMRTAFG